MQTNETPGSETWTDPDDAPELTKEMLDQAEVFQGDTFVRRGRGRPKSPDAKEQISVRIDRDILATLREAGPGWQSQINALLRQALDANAARAGVGHNAAPAILTGLDLIPDRAVRDLVVPVVKRRSDVHEG